MKKAFVNGVEIGQGAVQFELDRDDADLLTGLTAENFDARDVINFLFERLGDVGLDEFRVGTGVDGGDRDDGGVDVGQLADRKAGKRDNADEGD